MPSHPALYSVTRSTIEGFWKEYLQNLARVGLPHQFRYLESTGRLQNFRNCKLKMQGSHTGLRFNDSDAYKWCEAAAFVLEKIPDENLKAQFDVVVSVIEEAQQEDGYLFTLVQLNLPDWKWRNLGHMHEMYCLGHLLEAGIAADACLGDRRLLEVGLRFAEHLASIFGPGKRLGYCGHAEIELALIKLGRYVNDSKWVDLAHWMLNSRGTRPSPFEAEVMDPATNQLFAAANRLMLKDEKYCGTYAQDNATILEQTQVAGHAVRATYLYTAATMITQEKGDQTLLQKMDDLWQSLIQRRTYVTGGIGSTGENEGFTSDYDLPNLHAYAETCAGIGLALWGRELFRTTGDASYIEATERVLFNGILSGISLSTDRYAYDNPLENRGHWERSEFFSCACCPPNVARVIGQIESFAYDEDESTSYVHFPVAGEFQFQSGLQMTVKSSYPNDGHAEITVRVPRGNPHRLAIRIPDWAEEMTIEWVESESSGEYESGFAVYNLEAGASATFRLNYEMEPRWLESDPRVLENIGRAALQVGPTLFAAESSNFEDAPQHFSVEIDSEPEKLNPIGPTKDLQYRVSAEKRLIESFSETYQPVGEASFESSSLQFLPYRIASQAGPTYFQIWVRSNL